MEYHEQAEVLQVAKPPRLVDAGVLASALRIAANAVEINLPDAVELPEAVKAWLVEVIASRDSDLARVYKNELEVTP
jgi:hypothetical protein